MARRPKELGLESSADIARKAEILEREMATQRAALDRLKELAEARRPALAPQTRESAKRSA